METYRVKMNNTLSYPEHHNPAAPRKISFYHIHSNSIAEAIKHAEEQFAGRCEMASLKKLADKAFCVDDMQDYENYEIMADAAFSNDTAIFRKTGSVITVTLRGRDFSEKGISFWFDLSVLSYTKEAGIPHQISSLSLADLEAASAEIYNIVMEKEIPGIFNGMMNRLKT